VELMVLDDGWFGTEYPRTSKDALGDWVANPKRFPQGIQGIARDVHQQGMMFGIWVEPEMVSPNSLLFKQHSDWIIHQPNRFSTPVKHQYILDLGKKEVQDYLIKSISALIKEGDVDYLKWDMNRTMTEVGSSSLPSRRQMETQHRYMLGLYRVLDVLTRRFPDALFEGCAGGGGRFDPGMLQYFPQIWTSDNTDAVSRLHIQAGTARAYPPITMSAHVSNNPNGQVGRSTPLSFRCHVAMMGNFGIELNPAELTDDEKTYLRDQVALYKEIRPLIHHGNYSQLRGPESNWPSWQFTAPDQSEAVVFAFKPYAQTNNLMVPPLRLRNLDPEALYVVSGVNKPLTGAYLMHAGLNPNLETDANGQMLGDYTSTVIRIQKAAGSQKASALNLFV
jgi:alpha-galactosidase